MCRLFLRMSREWCEEEGYDKLRSGDEERECKWVDDGETNGGRI